MELRGIMMDTMDMLNEELTSVVQQLRVAKPGEVFIVPTKEIYDYIIKNNLNIPLVGPAIKIEYIEATPLMKATASEEPMLYRAEQLINGARQQEYGDKLRNFEQIADFWNAHLKYKLAPGCKVTAEDVALMMIGVKQARLAKTPTHEDSVLDIAGYIGCYDKILSERRTSNVEVKTNHHPV